MTDRPITMTGDSVRATLDGRKTQTRRVLRPQPVHAQRHTWHGRVVHDSEYRHFCWKGHVGADNQDNITKQIGPYLHYQPGDRLWVRETWKPGAWRGDGRVAIDYRASPELTNTPWVFIPETIDWDDIWLRWTDELRKVGSVPDEYGMHQWEPGKSPLRWRSPRFMPRWASRLTLIVTGVKVERLQDISAEDAIAEGADYEAHKCGCEVCATTSAICPASSSFLVMEYAAVWNAINGKRAGCTWDDNPWVAAIEYRHVAANIDAIRDAAE